MQPVLKLFFKCLAERWEIGCGVKKDVYLEIKAVSHNWKRKRHLTLDGVAVMGPRITSFLRLYRSRFLICFSSQALPTCVPG